MGQRLKEKVVLITGAASGLGAAAAGRCLEEGARVVCADLRGTDWSGEHPRLHGHGDAFAGIRCDHTRPADCAAAVETALERWGRLDVLFNNAGVGYAGNFADVAPQALRRVFDVDFFGPWQMTAAALPALEASAADGRHANSVVLFTASAIGLRARPNCAPYGTAKAAVLGLVHSLALDLGPSNVRVNAICPGLVDTPASRAMTAGWSGRTSDDVFDDYRRLSPMGRIAEAGDVAESVVFLASDEARAINSVALPVDYGTVHA